MSLKKTQLYKIQKIFPLFEKETIIMEIKIKFLELYKILQNLNRKKKKNDGEIIPLELQYRIK